MSLIKYQDPKDFVKRIQYGEVKTNKTGGGKSISMSFKAAPGVNSRVMLETPKLKCPFGLSGYPPDAPNRFTICLQFEDDVFLQLAKALDACNLAHATKVQDAFLGNTKPKKAELIAEKQFTLVKENEGYARTIRAKLEMTPKLEFKGMIVDKENNPLTYTNLLGETCDAVGLIEFVGLWMVGGNWGMKVVLHQMRHFPHEQLNVLMLSDYP